MSPPPSSAGSAMRALGGTLMAISSGPPATGQGAEIGPSGATLALAGLAAILGLVGALIGSALGSVLEHRLVRRSAERPMGSRDHALSCRRKIVRLLVRGASPARDAHDPGGAAQMATRIVRSRRVKVEPGEIAVAPRVDDPRGFALENRSGRPLTVSFRYDADAHLQVVVIEGSRAGQRPAGESSLPA